MRKYLYKKKLLLFLTVLCRVIGALMQVFIALLAERIVDTAIEKDMNNFIRIIIFTAIYLLVMGIFDYLTNTTQAVYLKNILKLIKEDIFTCIIKKEYKDFFNCNAADYISRLSNDINITPFGVSAPRIRTSLFTSDMLIGLKFITAITCLPTKSFALYKSVI